MKTIDLGRKSPSGPVAVNEEKNKVYYPNVYISNVKGLKLPEGDFEFTGRARVTSKTENMKDETCSYDLELMSITPNGESEDNDLEETMNRKAKKKMDEEESDEYD